MVCLNWFCVVTKSSRCAVRFLLSLSLLESLPSPSILADPGLVIPQRNSVKFICTSPSEYDTFRLEKHITVIMDKKNDFSSKKQAIFQLGPVNEDNAGSYQCLYQKGSNWSTRSETLELKVTSEDVPHTSDPVPGVTSGLFLGLWTLTLTSLPCLNFPCCLIILMLTFPTSFNTDLAYP